MTFKEGAELVKTIITENVDEQVRANLGGIVGGEEYEEFARRDLERYSKALEWFNENIINKTKK